MVVQTPPGSPDKSAGSAADGSAFRPTLMIGVSRGIEAFTMKTRKPLPTGMFVLLAFGVASCTGCAASNTDMLHFLREHEHQVSAIDYRIGIPDSIGISAPKIKEIDGDVQQIQPNGKISLRLLGDVKVVGMTAKEVAAKIEVLAGRYYSEPEVSARVVSFASKHYYVHGEIGGQGPRRYTGRDTLLDAVFGAGSNFLSWTSRVTVTRPAHGDTPVRTITVDIDKMLKTGDWSQNILLEPNDVVFVPPTPVAWLAKRIQEVLFPVSPVLTAYTTPLQFANTQDAYADQRLEDRRR